ncbi:protein prenylyltransferase [Meira miltonrushii]|uniref:Geranylgeranyl transferase type-2 subunit alpha n=1 Tax=Meira miltonrushii TaxID=1280837 RepID=A0A316VGU1_9BASI|nr:protein prenylyltransferase [Meira miltonrushii]PWN36867.1 protein prenylyltransferase [Meira miltonrushii]
MHGVKRDRSKLTAELKAQKKEKEAKKLQVYLDIEKRFFTKRDANELNQDALETTTELLSLNPELYSAWNFRRKILSHLFQQNREQDAEQPPKDFFASLRIDAEKEGESLTEKDPKSERKRQLLQEDLELTIQALQMHPKVYWIWNHRKWCLQELPSEDADGLVKWKHEIGMVNKMLELDARNFHGWDYRRYIQSQLALPVSLRKDYNGAPFPRSLLDADLPTELRKYQEKLANDELAYTLAKIESNFSNFSAWHQRSLLLPAIWSSQHLSEQQLRAKRDEEFELIRQAMFVDPDDQSVWTYHDWLINLDPALDVLDREIESIGELLELEPDSRWCMQSLANYLTQRRKEGDLQEAETLLGRLMVIDADRKERYADEQRTLKA